MPSWTEIFQASDARHIKNTLMLGIHDESDLLISCRGQVYPAHQAVVFKKGAFVFSRGAFANTLQEGDSAITIDENNMIVEKILSFCYTGDYKSNHFLIHLCLYGAALKYRIPKLKELAQSRFIEAMHFALECRSRTFRNTIVQEFEQAMKCSSADLYIKPSLRNLSWYEKWEALLDEFPGFEEDLDRVLEAEDCVSAGRPEEIAKEEIATVSANNEDKD